MRTNRVASNSLLTVIAEVADRIMRFLLVAVAARLLGDSNYGILTFAIAFASLFLILADFGLQNLFVREIARNADETRRLVGNGLVIKLVLAGVAFLCIYFVARLTGKPAHVLTTVYIISASLIIGSLAEFFCAVFQGFQKMKYYAAASFILSASNTLIGIAVLLLGGGLRGLAWVYLLSRALKLLYAVVVVRLRFTPITLRFEPRLMKYLVTEGMSFGLTRVFSMIYTYFDSTMLSLMVNDAVVGWYNVAYRLIFAIMVLPMGVMRSVYPALSAYHRTQEAAFHKLFARTFKLMLIAGTSVATLLFVLADKVIVLLFGAEYIRGAGALKILVWSTAFYFVGTVVAHAISAIGRQRFITKVVAASAVLNIGLNFVLIPKYSLYGAAFATLASEFFTFVFDFWYLSRYLTVRPLLRLLPKVAVINVGLFLALSWSIDFPLVIVALIFVFVYVLLVLGTRFFSKAEWLDFKAMVRASSA